MKLIVNIPAFNEQEKIGQTIKNISKSFESDFYVSGKGRSISDKKIQVIDDGSKDKTANFAIDAGADIVISHETNRRLGVAFKTGVENALKQGVDFMVNIDADGQFDPNDIPKLLGPVLDNQIDMVIANRFGTHEAKNIPWVKEVLNRVAAGIIGFFLAHKIDDLTCGFRAYNRETLLRLNLSGVFTYTQETIIDAIGKNLKLAWVPVEVVYFDDRQSRMTKSIWKFVNNSSKIILKAVRDVRPLKFFGWPGLTLVAIGVIVFAIFLFNYLTNDFRIRPYLNYIIFSSISMMFGVQLVVFALIADMIKSNRQLTEEMMYRIRKTRFESDKKEVSDERQVKNTI